MVMNGPMPIMFDMFMRRRLGQAEVANQLVVRLGSGRQAIHESSCPKAWRAAGRDGRNVESAVRALTVARPAWPQRCARRGTSCGTRAGINY